MNDSTTALTRSAVIVGRHQATRRFTEMGTNEGRQQGLYPDRSFTATTRLDSARSSCQSTLTRETRARENTRRLTHIVIKAYEGVMMKE